MENIVVVDAKRTPCGAMMGQLSPWTASDLGSYCLRSHRELLGEAEVNEVFLGCVLPAGQGQAPARQAVRKAGFPDSTPATTINKMCGSGMKSVMLAMDLLRAHPEHIYIAGGMESMTHAPYLLPKARSGYRLGHGQLLDHMFLDGLEDHYEPGKLMGVFADQTARDHQISRQAQDEFALTSLERAKAATPHFKTEIVSLEHQGVVINTDEPPLRAKPEKIPQLKPAFSKEGTVTAANASSIADGAASLILMTESRAKALGLKPLVILSGHSTVARAPSEFTIAPSFAIEALCKRLDWSMDSIDAFEINEAFAVVTLAAMHQLKLDQHKVNRRGGACALGHPIGASGARILVTLIHLMQQEGLHRGIASACIGGGEATALALTLWSGS